MKVSFVIPAYNVEKYIIQCVDSVLSQTYTDYEIVLVDDGSTDKTPSICDSLAEKDGRITVIHKKNEGLSEARNTGLRKSVGEYVVFMDSDDFWNSKDDLKFLIDSIETLRNVDFIGFNCSYFFERDGSYEKWIPYNQSLTVPMSGSESLIKLVALGTIPMSACLKVIKRDFLINNNLFFQKGITCEDIPWFINLLNETNACTFINRYVYAYRQGVLGSLSSSLNEKKFVNLLNIIQQELTILDERKFSAEAKESLKSFLAYELSILLSYMNIFQRKDRHSIYAELKSLCWLLSYTQCPKVKMVYKMYRVFGLNVTIWILRCYNFYRNLKR